MKTIFALAIILSVNVFLFLGGNAIQDINGSDFSFFNPNNNMIGKYDTGNYTLTEDLTGNLPSGSGSISPETGNLFTDTFSTLKNWFLDTTGLGFIFDIVNALPNFLKIFLDPTLAYALGFFWHVLTIFLIINFIKGGE